MGKMNILASNLPLLAAQPSHPPLFGWLPAGKLSTSLELVDCVICNHSDPIPDAAGAKGWGGGSVT